jgi:Mg2+ and Co2+ transporter CorA
MKVLTLVSVLVLPATALAGIIGCTSRESASSSTLRISGWRVAAMILIAAVTLVVARVRRWI